MKKVVFLLAVLLSTTTTFAQTDDGELLPPTTIKEKSSAFFIGPKVGAVMTTMGQPEQGDLYDSFGTGFSAGLAMKARFGKATENSAGGTGFWGLGLELKYKNNSVKTIGIDEEGGEDAKLSLDYFEVPAYLQVYPFAKTRAMNSFYVELGASFAGTIGRSPKTLTVPNANGVGSVIYEFDTENSTLKGMDVRALAGIGYTIPGTGLDINARYYMGTSDLAENFACKMNSFEISLSWMFTAFKF